MEYDADTKKNEKDFESMWVWEGVQNGLRQAGCRTVLPSVQKSVWLSVCVLLVLRGCLRGSDGMEAWERGRETYTL